MRWAYPELLRSYFSLRAEVGLWYVTVRAIVLLRVVGAEAASAAGERSAKLFMLLQKCMGLCFEAAFGFGLRRKGLGEAFGLWICVLR
nr:uncharacterized protein LOC112715487 isoform X2 [Arachis hypogaea]